MEAAGAAAVGQHVGAQPVVQLCMQPALCFDVDDVFYEFLQLVYTHSATDC